MREPLLLGIDLGTTNCKAIIFTPQGRLVAAASLPTPTHHPRPEWSEHDPEELWQTIAAAIRQVVRRVDPAQIRGLSVASVGESGTLIDASGRALVPMITWHDSRSAPQMRAWLEHVDQERANAITEMPAKPIFTLFKLQWLRAHYTDAYRAATHWLLAADYIAFRLCGGQATDFSLASRTLMLDLRGRCWSDELIELAGLRRELLPPLRPAGDYLGTVTPAAADETGLHPGTVVAVGGHDHIVGAFATGIVSGGQCLDSLGTAEATFMALDAAPSPGAAQHTSCTFGAHVARDRYFVLDGLLSGGGSIGWARSLLTPGADGYGQLETLAAGSPPGSRGAIFLPRLAAGERGAFAGLTFAAGPAELARAVYEGLAYGWRQLLELVESATGQRANSIKLIGGGVRSPIWVQLKANVLRRPLLVLSLEESVALGAAMLGGLAAGVYTTEAEAIAQIQLDERVVEPEPALSDFYEQRYREAFLPLAPGLARTHTALLDE